MNLKIRNHELVIPPKLPIKYVPDPHLSWSHVHQLDWKSLRCSHSTGDVSFGFELCDFPADYVVGHADRCGPVHIHSFAWMKRHACCHKHLPLTLVEASLELVIWPGHLWVCKKRFNAQLFARGDDDQMGFWLGEEPF